MGILKDLATCLLCNHKQMVKHREWIRASRPRCVACGGAIEQSAVSRDEHAAHRDAKYERDVMCDAKTKGKRQ